MEKRLSDSKTLLHAPGESFDPVGTGSKVHCLQQLCDPGVQDGFWDMADFSAQSKILIRRHIVIKLRNIRKVSNAAGCFYRFLLD